jgi:ATP-dependent Lon protease
MSEELTPETLDKPTVPELLPFLTLSDEVVFPSMVIPLIVQGEREVKAIENAALGQKIVGLFWRSASCAATSRRDSKTSVSSPSTWGHWSLALSIAANSKSV